MAFSAATADVRRGCFQGHTRLITEWGARHQQHDGHDAEK
jgi:hypothetical protein